MDEHKTINKEHDEERMILIKDGKEYEVSDRFILDEKIGPRLEKMHKSKNELHLIMKSLDCSAEKAEQLSEEDSFKGLTDNGYSIIKIYKGCAGWTLNELFIANQISKADAAIIEKIEKSYMTGKDSKRVEIYNRVNSEYGKEYNYVNILKSKTDSEMRTYKILECIRTFINEKIGNLNKDQQEMLSHYRKFDLKRLITIDEKTKYALNNGNAGLIIIAPDKVYRSTCKKEIHLRQISSIMENQYYNEFQMNRDATLYSKPSEQEIFHSIMIQLSNNIYYPAIFWSPEKINEFQYQQLLNVIDEIEEIEKTTNARMPISYSGGINHGQYIESDSTGNFKSELIKNHDNMVDNSINLKRNFPPESKKLAKKEILDEFCRDKEEEI